MRRADQAGIALLLLAALSGCTGSCPRGAEWHAEDHRFEGCTQHGAQSYGIEPVGTLHWYYLNGHERAVLNYPARSIAELLPGRLARWWRRHSKPEYPAPLRKSPAVRIVHPAIREDLAPLRARMGAGLGRLDGKAQAWNRDGSRLFEASFREGSPQGHWIAWHPEGTKAFEGDFDRGIQVGVWRYWYPSGRLALEARYADRAEESIPPGPWKVSAPDASDLRPVTKPSPPQIATLGDLWLEDGVDEILRLFGEVLSEFTVREPKQSPFGRIDSAEDMRRWLGFDLAAAPRQ